jgi:hypothetical protein
MARTGKTREESREVLAQAKDNPFDLESTSHHVASHLGSFEAHQGPRVAKGFLKSHHVSLLLSNKQMHYGKISQKETRTHTTYVDPFHPIDCNP